MSEIDVWVTKYALTTGVFESRGVATPEGSFCGTGCAGMSVTRKEWARTADEAVEQVKSMVERRQDALTKERAKLTRMAAELAAGVLPMMPKEPT